MTNIDKEIGLRLKIARKSAEYKTALDFANKMQIPKSTYSQHENGKRSLTAEQIIYYSNKLDIEPSWLLTGLGHPCPLGKNKAERKEKIEHEIMQLQNSHELPHFKNPHIEISDNSAVASIVYQIFQDGTYLYNGSISPTYYENLDFYTWDQCFDKRFYSQVKLSLQIKNGIETGIIMVHRAFGFNILFSFASKCKNNDLFVNATENSQDFLRIGFHCLNLIKEIYSQYYENNEMLLIKEPDYIKPICRLPNLILIK